MYPHLPFRCRSPHPQYDLIWRWVFKQVINVKWDRIVVETAKTVAVEWEKQHLEIWKSKVYSVPVWAQRSHLQSLSTRSLFSVTFIHYKVLIFPCKHPGPPPSPSRQCSSLRNWASKVTEVELISNAGYMISRADGLDTGHTVATLLQEGWNEASIAGRVCSCLFSQRGLFFS